MCPAVSLKSTCHYQMNTDNWLRAVYNVSQCLINRHMASDRLKFSVNAKQVRCSNAFQCHYNNIYIAQYIIFAERTNYNMIIFTQVSNTDLCEKTNMFPHPPNTKYIIPSPALTLMHLLPSPHSSHKVCSHSHPAPQLTRHDPAHCTENCSISYFWKPDVVVYCPKRILLIVGPAKIQNLQVFPQYDRKNHYRYRGFSGISVPMLWLNRTFYSISRKYPRKFFMQVSTEQLTFFINCVWHCSLGKTPEKPTAPSSTAKALGDPVDLKNTYVVMILLESEKIQQSPHLVIVNHLTNVAEVTLRKYQTNVATNVWQQPNTQIHITVYSNIKDRVKLLYSNTFFRVECQK